MIVDMHVGCVLLAVCQKSIRDAEGTIMSPSYPENYPNNTQCWYNFPSLEPGYRYVITFNTFELEASANESCDGDFLEVGFGIPSDVVFSVPIWSFPL